MIRADFGNSEVGDFLSVLVKVPAASCTILVSFRSEHFRCSRDFIDPLPKAVSFGINGQFQIFQCGFLLVFIHKFFTSRTFIVRLYAVLHTGGIRLPDKRAEIVRGFARFRAAGLARIEVRILSCGINRTEAVPRRGYACSRVVPRLRAGGVEKFFSATDAGIFILHARFGTGCKFSHLFYRHVFVYTIGCSPRLNGERYFRHIRALFISHQSAARNMEIAKPSVDIPCFQSRENLPLGCLNRKTDFARNAQVKQPVNQRTDA